MAKKRKKGIHKAPQELEAYVREIKELPYITDVSFCGFDKVNRHLEEGCHLDRKAAAGYTRGKNGIPLILFSKKRPGGLKAIAYSAPGSYDEAYRAVMNYILDGCGRARITGDTGVRQHLEQLGSLPEVERIVMIELKETDRSIGSGIHEILDSEAHIDCTIVGRQKGAGMRARIIPRKGHYGDVRWLLSKYSEYFGESHTGLQPSHPP